MTQPCPKHPSVSPRATRHVPSHRRVGPRPLFPIQRKQLTYPVGTVITNDYNARGLLASLSMQGPPPLAAFTYDARGQRTMRAYENGTTAYYTNDAAGQLLALAHVKTNGGSVMVQVNYGYNEVGNRTNRVESFTGYNAATDVYGYDSTDQLTNVKLNDHRFRFYTPEVQRWLSRDPIAEKGGLNLYAFLMNDPGGRTDPLGLADQGAGGGRCCNKSAADEWSLVPANDGTGTNKWVKLKPGECTDFGVDCDGMTCGGAFYAVGLPQAVVSAGCVTPGKDNCWFRRKRWTPRIGDKGRNFTGPESPKDRGSPDNDPPPGYEWSR